MGYFNFKWQVYSASATRRTYDRNTDKGEVGGSSPPRPTIQNRSGPGVPIMGLRLLPLPSALRIWEQNGAKRWRSYTPAASALPASVVCKPIA
jgi:hypothetical protein